MKEVKLNSTNVLQNLCTDEGPSLIDNFNIKGIKFYKGVLHWLDRGQNILSNKFILSLKDCENSYLTPFCYKPRRK